MDCTAVILGRWYEPSVTALVRADGSRRYFVERAAVLGEDVSVPYPRLADYIRRNYFDERPHPIVADVTAAGTEAARQVAGESLDYRAIVVTDDWIEEEAGDATFVPWNDVVAVAGTAVVSGRVHVASFLSGRWEDGLDLVPLMKELTESRGEVDEQRTKMGIAKAIAIGVWHINRERRNDQDN